MSRMRVCMFVAVILCHLEVGLCSNASSTRTIIPFIFRRFPFRRSESRKIQAKPKTCVRSQIKGLIQKPKHAKIARFELCRIWHIRLCRPPKSCKLITWCEKENAFYFSFYFFVPLILFLFLFVFFFSSIYPYEYI